ncbi:MAG: hypothetical protein ACR2L2_13750 [Acidobacteriota bacterium]
MDEKTLTHANCGGKIRRDPTTLHYICERCNAEADSQISAGDVTAGKPEEVTLCNSHSDKF